MHKWMLFLVIACLSVSNKSIAQDATPAAPERVLAISTVPILVPPLTSDNAIERYTIAMKKADDAGVKGNLITKRWSELEPSAGQYTLDDFSGDLNYRTATYYSIELVGIQVLNTTAKETPSDLMKVAFDSPQMIDRFQKLWDALLPHLNKNGNYSGREKRSSMKGSRKGIKHVDTLFTSG
ncbi:MAG: hypothetical protein H0X30_22080 [Anaerolineae bacterium]|nr:hypothetical protein [Anaerolineae bacterium]